MRRTGVVAFLESWVLPYAEDPNLRPVWVALLGHLWIVVLPLMLGVWRSGSVVCALLLGALALGSLGLVGVEVRSAGRPGWWAAGLLGTWVLAAVGVGFAERTGVL